MIYFEKPQLFKPFLIAGFEGWPNAAEVSSFALQHLVETLKAKKFASIPFEDFYQTSTSRPVASIKDGRLVELEFPGNHFYYAKTSPRDLILFYGIEPHLHWTDFVHLFFEVAVKFDVSQIFTLGGTYDYFPHTLPPRVSALYNHEDLREQVLDAGVSLTEYEGPISIHTFLLEAARKRGLRGVSLWGHAPHYLQTKNIRVVLSVLKRLMALTKIEINLAELRKSCEAFDQEVEQWVGQDAKLQDIVRKMEEIYTESHPSNRPSKTEEGSKKEEKVVYIRAFLKKLEDEEKK